MINELTNSLDIQINNNDSIDTIQKIKYKIKNNNSIDYSKINFSGNDSV
tara:strand:- start:429 stop:575 length:147 start_codon:yes stop_codon:yes gene_type:complete